MQYNLERHMREHITFLKRKCYDMERELHYERKVNGVLDATVKVQHKLLFQEQPMPPPPPPPLRRTGAKPPPPPPSQVVTPKAEQPAKKAKKETKVPALTCTINDIMQHNFEAIAKQDARALLSANDKRMQKLAVFHDVATEFNSIIGESKLKKDVFSLLIDCMQNERQNQCRNIVLSGPSGTGKTTMATIIANALVSTECYDKKKIKKVGRADLVAGFLGQTAIKVRELFEQQRGGVIIIDEAYSLSRDTKDMFSREAMDTLVDEVTKDNNQTVLIFIGYDEEMEVFLECNKGLRRRLPIRWKTSPLDEVSAMKVMQTMLVDRGWTIDKKCIEKVADRLRLQSDINGGNIALIVDEVVKSATERLWVECTAPWESANKKIVYKDVKRLKKKETACNRNLSMYV